MTQRCDNRGRGALSSTRERALSFEDRDGFERLLHEIEPQTIIDLTTAERLSSTDTFTGIHRGTLAMPARIDQQTGRRRTK